MKSSQALQTIAINLAWRGATLVAEFSRGFFKGRLRVTKAVAAIRAGKLPVDEDSHTGFASTGAGFVRREYARCRGGNNQGFRFREKTKRDTNRLIRRPKEGSFAVERINEDAPQSCSGKREKMAAAHVRECNRGTQGAARMGRMPTSHAINGILGEYRKNR